MSGNCARFLGVGEEIRRKCDIGGCWLGKRWDGVKIGYVQRCSATTLVHIHWDAIGAKL